MADEPESLTASSRLALRWAWAAATARTGKELPPDTLDLLAGIALAHLRDSPARELLEHFDIPLGAVLSADGRRRYEAEALLQAAAKAPDAVVPPDTELDEIIRHASTTFPPSDDGLTTLSMLFGALLETTNPASAAIRRRLAERGEDAEAVVRPYAEFLGGREPYREFLRRRHPRRPLELPPYAADEPLARLPDTTEPDASDLVGIGPEVDAFAYLIASRRLTPPLAVGLFGNWGSGKSYFLRSLQRRIDQVAATAAAATEQPTPFHTAIAQIEFNAWQYVEGDLWASLLEHLFRNLRISPDESDDLLKERRNYWLRQIDEATADRAKARTDRVALEEKRHVAAADVGRRLAERDIAIAELERRQRERPRWEPSPELEGLREEVAQRTGFDNVATEAAGVAAELARSGEALREVGALLAPLRERGWKYATLLIVALLVTPGITIALDFFDLSAVTSAAGSAAWVLATVAGYLKIGNSLLRSGLDKVAEAERQLAEDTKEARTELDAKVAKAEQHLTEVTSSLATAIEQERSLDERAGKLTEQLADVTPAKVLNDFIAERTGSNDYRSHLGIPAVVRQDLERLSRLIGQQRAGTGCDAPHAVERVVLYIDDLDRCPTELVIKVLEAVHLLLAFPLFVVVVAVDSRWLESSLREHYAQLRDQGAAPADYLEKIFQVPFRVRSLDSGVRRQMVRALLTPSLRAAVESPEQGAEALDAPGRLGVSVADRPYFDEVLAEMGRTQLPDRRWSTAADLTVTTAEVAQIDELADLLGATPRTLKRYVNVYLLVKALGRGRGWPVPDGGQVALLLALATTMPELTEALVPALHADTAPLTLGSAVPTAGSLTDPAAEQRARLTAWLDAHPDWAKTDLSAHAHWADTILQFTFNRRNNATAPTPRVSHPNPASPPSEPGESPVPAR